jgi:hypothetical protein
MTRRNIQVFLLYRRALRELSNNLDRETLCIEARKVRAEFDEHRGEPDQGKVQFLIDRANFWLDQVRHSEPYVSKYHLLCFVRCIMMIHTQLSTVPNHPGGVAYLRNPQMELAYIKRHSSLTENPEQYAHH